MPNYVVSMNHEYISFHFNKLNIVTDWDDVAKSHFCQIVICL